MLRSFLPDCGEYGRELLNGDIHQINADKLGISREHMKTVQYATLYGSGDTRLGEILGKGAKEGRELKAAYFKLFLNFGATASDQESGQRTWLLARPRWSSIASSQRPRSLNVLLQSAGALISKNGSSSSTKKSTSKPRRNHHCLGA